MSAKSERAVRMSRAANRGNPTAAGFPIVDEVTLRLRLAEFRQAEKRVEQAVEELGKLQRHIVRRGFALAEKLGDGVLNALPLDWVADEFGRRVRADLDAEVAKRLAGIEGAGSAVRALLTDPDED